MLFLCSWPSLDRPTPKLSCPPTCRSRSHRTNWVRTTTTASASTTSTIMCKMNQVCQSFFSFSFSFVLSFFIFWLSFYCYSRVSDNRTLSKKSNSTHMLSIQIDSHHQFNDIKLSFFASHMKRNFPLCTDIRYSRVLRRRHLNGL